MNRRMTAILCAMGAWLPHIKREAALTFGPIAAEKMHGHGHYRHECAKGAGIKRSHSFAEQSSVGARAFNRRREFMTKFGAFKIQS